MLKTEMRNEKTMHIDTMSTEDMLSVIQEENMNAVKAVGAQIKNIALAVDKINEAFAKGGRLIYLGAGTSGRLGVLDASECPPTFGVSPDTVVGIIAGGDKALRKASEGAEDSGEAGISDLKNIGLNSNDVVCGISAAGGAEYVVQALLYAKSLGCTTIGITSNEGTKLDETADISIVTDTGAEVVTGSTRMKAGTAQKLVLNMLSTGAMIKSGKVYENLMINLSAKNDKLIKRMIRIVSDIKKIPEEEAEKLLEKSDWNIRKAVSMEE